MRGVVPDRAAVAADVRRIVGGCRSRGDFERLETPAIDQLLALDGRTHDDGPELLAAAIGEVDRDNYRQLLELLLPLPFEEGERWPSLGPSRKGPGRGDLAARVFDLDTWDGCTRASATLDGRSRREWAELHLASSLINQATAHPHPGERSPVGSAQVADDQWRFRPRRAVAAAVVGLVAIVAAVLAADMLHRDPPETDRSAGTSTTADAAASKRPQRVMAATCVPVGTLDARVADEPDAAAVSSTLSDVYERAGGASQLGCGAEAASRWDRLVVQPVDSGEEGLPAALVVSSPGNGVYLTPSQWGSYRRVGSADGRLVQAVGGVPEQVVTLPDGSVEIGLSEGVLLVGERHDAPFFWIPAPFVQWWRDHPELGRPTGNPLPTLAQHFEHGRAVAGIGTPDPEVQLVADPASELPASSERGNHILRQLDGTAWWIDDEDRRHWIATGAVWDCLGGESVAVDRDVAGYAIATLPLSGHAECPETD